LLLQARPSSDSVTGTEVLVNATKPVGQFVPVPEWKNFGIQGRFKTEYTLFSFQMFLPLSRFHPPKLDGAPDAPGTSGEKIE
jgi:hypothetical protein